MFRHRPILRPFMRPGWQPVAASAVLFATAAGFILLQACGGSPVAPNKDTEPGCSGVQLSTEACDGQYNEGEFWPDFDALPCPPRVDIEEVQREIPLTIKSDASAGKLACREEEGSANLTLAQFEIYQALLFLRRLRFDAPLPWTEQTVYQWLRSTIPAGIVLDSTGNSHSCLNCAGPVTIVLADGHWSPFNRSISGMPYEGIVHEARHADGWDHTCKYNTSGRFIRDRTVSEMGAFGVQYFLNLWLDLHSTEPEPFRKYSRRRAAELRTGFCCECGNARVMSLIQRPGTLQDRVAILP